MIRRILFYVIILSIPAFLALSAWQSSRYGDLKRELENLKKNQEVWVESNKRLIANIASYSSPERIERIARDELGLRKKRPEEVLHISITDSYTDRGAPPSALHNDAQSSSADDNPADLEAFIAGYGAANE